jgi:hypothetical protein
MIERTSSYVPSFLVTSLIPPDSRDWILRPHHPDLHPTREKALSRDLLFILSQGYPLHIETTVILGERLDPIYFFSSGGLIDLKLRYSMRS